MRLIQDPASGTSSCAGLSKLMDALIFMDNCKKDSSIITSDQWSSTIKSLLDEVTSLRTLFRYTEIGHEGYHEFQNLVTKAIFFISRALNNNHLYREDNWNCAYVLVDSMEDLRLAVEEIYHFIASKLPASRACLSEDVLAESINYLVRLARMNSSGLRLEDEVAFWRQIDFLEFLSSHVSGHHIMNEFNTPEHILVDTLAAVDTAIYILSEFDPLHYPWLYSDVDLIDLAANIGISSDQKLRKLGKNVEFISIAIYAVIGKGPMSSWLNEVEVQYWDYIIDIILHILHQETILIVPWKDQMGVLHDELSFLRYFLLDPPKEYTETENTDKGLQKINLKICKQVSALMYSFYDTKLRKGAIGEIRETIDSFKFLSKEYCQVPYFVKLDQRKKYVPGSRDASWKRLSILIHSESLPIPFCRSKQVLEQLTYLENSLHKISGVEMLNGNLQVEIMDLAIVLEYVMKPPEVRRLPVWQRILWFLNIVDRIKLIKETMDDAKHVSNYESVGLVGEKEYIALTNKLLVMQQRRGSIWQFKKILAHKVSMQCR